MSVQRALQAASAEDVHALCARLLAFNRKASGNSFDELPLQLANHGQDGTLRGGLLGDICAGWLTIHGLWVDPELRGQGLGSQLLQAEQQAKVADVHSVVLDTFDWQAEGFYLLSAPWLRGIWQTARLSTRP